MDKRKWRVVVVGGHTRSIGKTQLVCDVIAAFPDVPWIAGKITQYGHGICAQNGENCDCAPREHQCAFEWESRADSGKDTSRFLAAGAKRSFWLRTKQGFLAEALPMLRGAMHEALSKTDNNSTALIVESNSLMQFLKPTLYLAVVDPDREDFKESARRVLDRADGIVLRRAFPGANEARHGDRGETKFLKRLLGKKLAVEQRQGSTLPDILKELLQGALDSQRGVFL